MQRLSRQTLATASSSGIDNSTPIFGSHTGTEAVGTLALQDAGLESTFHDRNSLYTRLKFRERDSKESFK